MYYEFKKQLVIVLLIMSIVVGIPGMGLTLSALYENEFARLPGRPYTARISIANLNNLERDTFKQYM